MVTAAVIGGVAAIGGAVISGRAAEEAAETGARAQERAASTILEAGNRARTEILDLFPQAQRQLLAGSQAAIDAFGAGIPLQQQQLQQGNLQAQQTTARGFEQQRAALLGLAVPQFQAGAPIISRQSGPTLGGFQLPEFGGLGLTTSADIFSSLAGANNRPLGPTNPSGLSVDQVQANIGNIFAQRAANVGFRGFGGPLRPG